MPLSEQPQRHRQGHRRVAVTAATLTTYAQTKPSVAGWTAGGTVTHRKHAGLNVHVNMS